MGEKSSAGARGETGAGPGAAGWVWGTSALSGYGLNAAHCLARPLRKQVEAVIIHGMSDESLRSQDGGTTRSGSDGLADIPNLLRSVLDSIVQLGQARMELATAELKAEVEQRIRRLVLVVVPVCLILTALGLVNLGLVAWLAESVGPVVASFLLAGIYATIGVLWLLWWRASGGLNPREPGDGRSRGGEARPGTPGEDARR